MTSAKLRNTCGTSVAALILNVVAAHASVEISSAPTMNMNCSAGVCTPTAKSAVLNVDDLTAMLSSADITVKSGNSAVTIVIASPFAWASTHRLTLDANLNVNIKAQVMVEGTAGLTIITNDGGSGGMFLTRPTGHIAFWDTSSSLIINGASYTLVSNIASLATDVAANPSGNYALANNYDASVDGTYRTNPIPALHGNLEGLGNKVANLTIWVVRKDEPANLGFIDNLDAGSLVENLSLTGARIINGPERLSGILSPNNSGTIVNVHVTGRVVGSIASTAGGLVAWNDGTIRLASSAGTVEVKNGSMAGGLVGIQYQGEIDASHSAANVMEETPHSSNFRSFVGGLVGDLGGSLTQSWASGTVAAGSQNGTSSLLLGGLVGFLDRNTGAPGSIANSYALGAVNGGAGTYVGGLIGGKGGPLDDSYSKGAVSGGPGAVFGGLLGYDDGKLNANDYWDRDTSGVSDPSRGAGSISNDPGIVGLTDTQSKSGLPTGFDPKIWAQSAGINNGYPYLIANPPQ